MIRFENNPARPDFQSIIENEGLLWHGQGDQPYWSETQHVSFDLKSIEILEDAANELHQMCLTACNEIVSQGWWKDLAIPEHAVAPIIASWENQDTYMYGRFDLAWTGSGSPKLLEYNADTPTSLLEASVIQWNWLESLFPEDDQLNSLHETLVERWNRYPEQSITFACSLEHLEDHQTTAYLAETAEQAGKMVELIDISEIGYNAELQQFTNINEEPIERLFKLYPWEDMAKETFFQHVIPHRSQFTEPLWKMMLSNKGLLAILWKVFPDHPLLLPSYLSPDPLRTQLVSAWMAKPFFGREGKGISIENHYSQANAEILYPELGPKLYQQQTELFQSQGNHFVWGMWMIGAMCCGMTTRADRSAITGNLSRFIPHRIRKG